MKKIYILLWVLWPCVLSGQIFLDPANTKDMALVARASNNKGYLYFKGEVNRSGEERDYDRIEARIFRTSYLVSGSQELGSSNLFDTQYLSLSYSGDLAVFDFPIEITAELFNYSIEVTFIEDSSSTENNSYYILNVVAGDVFVIQGQSNGVATNHDGTTISQDQNSDPFVRTLGSCRPQDDILIVPKYNEWREAKTGPNQGSEGFIGEWGIRLAKLIKENQGIPVAILNGSTGGRSISYFQKDYDDPINTSNNYSRLLHRLASTNLREAVRGIFWSQGEANSNITNPDVYVNQFNDLISDWEIDYPNLSKYYILQTKSGCGVVGDDSKYGIYLKEAQRRLAHSNNKILIVPTTGLTSFVPEGDLNCHFTYLNGYEEFAHRLYKLVDRDFYGNNSYTSDIGAPMITDAFLIDETTLVLNTDATSLSVANPTFSDFVISDAQAGSFINGISAVDNEIFVYLNQYPGNSAKITFRGLTSGENRSNFVVNSQGLELICFADYPIDASRITVWEANNWSNGAPNSTKYAIVKSDYSVSNNDLEAINLTIRPGADLDFDQGNTTTIIVHNKLILEGNLTVGDTESLLMLNPSADGIDYTGTYTKIEKSAPKLNQYSVTYWSAPVEGVDLNTQYDQVPSDRKFHLNPGYSNPLYSGGAYDKYKHWQVATGNMVAGKGYSIDGPSNGVYPNFVETVSFTGKPNNGSISVPIFIDQNDAGSLTGYDANLLGNPYSSAIDADVFIARNSSIFSGSIYFWSQQTNPEGNGGEYHENDYVTYNFAGSSNNTATNNIGSGQGFMIIASQNGTITFENDMQIPGSNNQFYKSEITKKNDPYDTKANRIWLKLKNENNLVKDILIGFFDEASDGVDIGFDALSLSDTEMKFYSLLGEKRYVIQGLGSYSSGKDISLGMEVDVPGTFVIEISKIEGILSNESVLLEDKFLGIIHDLNVSPYTFTISSEGEQNGRFKLLFKSKLPDVPSLTEEDVRIISQVNGFHFESNSEMQGIEVYDILGRSIAKVEPNGFTYDLLIPTIKEGSVVVINVIFDQGRVKKYKRIKI